MARYINIILKFHKKDISFNLPLSYSNNINMTSEKFYDIFISQLNIKMIS